jgi:hypothetical protein
MLIKSSYLGPEHLEYRRITIKRVTQRKKTWPNHNFCRLYLRPKTETPFSPPMAPFALVLFLLCSPVHALFTPLDRTEFQVGKWECLKENPTGHCPLFAGKAPIPGQGTGTNGLLPQWDMSNVQALSSCFRGDANFQQNLENWTMTSLQNAGELFMNSKFDGAGLEQWDVSRVLKAESMFQGAINFNADLSSWNVASLTNIKGMFYGATKMDFNVENWGRTMPQQPG